MKKPRANSREKILAAAADVARESGPGNLSLDAVAQRAGVSKGGLLYNFPSKAKLMQALVEHHLQEFQEVLETARRDCAQGNLLAAYVKLSAKKFEEDQPPSAWIFSAIAENPDFLAPIRIFQRELFDRLKAETPDFKALLLTYFAVEGMRSASLFDFQVLSEQERESLVSSLLSVAKGNLAPVPAVA